jgi:hypothetical protein
MLKQAFFMKDWLKIDITYRIYPQADSQKDDPKLIIMNHTIIYQWK